MPKAHAVYDDKGYCTACYYRLTIRVLCSDCGKQMRMLPGGVALCKTCRIKGRSCARCGKNVPQAALTLTNGDVACPSCARFFEEPKSCPVCGQMSIHLARDFKNGFTEPVCPRCRRKGHITCPCCGKNRNPEGATSDGIIVCKGCLVTDGRPFTCPRCGKDGKKYSKNKCVDCYWLDYTDKKCRDAVALLRHEWLRTAFFGFIKELSATNGAQPVAMRIEKYFLFFATLDGRDVDQGQITTAMLAAVFGADGLRRQATPFGYMTKHNLLPTIDEAELKDADELKRQLDIIEVHEPGWCKDLLVAFHAYLLSIQKRYRKCGWVKERERFQSRTITMALRTASLFLHSVSETCISATQIDQIALECFIATNPGSTNNLRTFIRFINRTKKLFKKLKVETVTHNLPPELFLSHQRYNELIRTWILSPDESLKESLICLIMFFCAQTVKKTVRVKLSDLIKSEDGLFHVKFGRTEITINQKMSEVFTKYIAKRKALSPMEDDWENDYLFPGRRRGEHLSEGAVSGYLKKYEVTAEMIFSSALYYAYLTGMRQAKVLVKAFGITDLTAIKYMNIINPRLRDEIENPLKNKING